MNIVDKELLFIKSRLKFYLKSKCTDIRIYGGIS